MILIAGELLLGIIFLIICFISFVIPFYLVVKKFDNTLDDLEKVTISAVLGLVVFTLFAYFFAAVHLRFLMYAFPLLGLISLIKLRKDFLRFKLASSS